ncbi:CRISPR-associated protein Csx18 [Spirulina sp. CS-785/01]|uniref:CRISPR-associated protein Csx18 n=1 Tax=Spirulina sp. CS-785/01 TaxID=3021716 RepID=UPI002330A20B|nr:CRISPR-associated protein Csx18 [Spirulina sp. CS-785/01]MDB9313716.1 CRISPR-associated protein Csx18 [Spirulina sp. CS-785/01]
MYISTRAALVRSGVVAGVNCAITLTLLLIAPLGLAAVITNTLFITASTFGVCVVGDWVVAWLGGGVPPSELPRGVDTGVMQERQRDDIRRF